MLQSKQIIPTIQPQKTIDLDVSEVIKKASEIKSFPLIPVSAYAGKGTYEKTSEVKAVNLGFGFESLSKSQEDFKPISITKETPKSKQEFKAIDLDKLTAKTKQRQIQIPVLKLTQTGKQQQEFKQEELQKLKLEQTQRLISKQDTETLQVQKLQFKKPDTKERIKLFQRLKSIAAPVMISPPVSETENTKIIKTGNLYKVYVRRFGEFHVIGKYESLKEAKEKLRGFLKETLGASGFIEGTKKRITFKELFGSVETPEFRPSKKDISIIVQKRGFRLGTYPEKKEIQYFKAIKSKAEKLNLIGKQIKISRPKKSKYRKKPKKLNLLDSDEEDFLTFKRKKKK